MHTHNIVLMADDDEDDRLLFKLAVNDIDPGKMVVFAVNGEDLLQQLDFIVPDIIFLDINMPLKNGIECLQEIRSIPQFDKTPVIILSTSKNKDTIDQTYKHGANLYISKPSAFTDIRKMVHKLITLKIDDYFPQRARENYVVSFNE